MSYKHIFSTLLMNEVIRFCLHIPVALQRQGRHLHEAAARFTRQRKHGKNPGRAARLDRILRIYTFQVESCRRTHLRPLVGLRVVSFNGAQIHLSVITADGKETVPKETNANRVPADAHWGDRCPRVCLRVVPARRPHPRVCREKEADPHYQHDARASTVRPLI